jgi:acyl phosphate:glycerol-3-phosphate acyltransferase
LLTAAAIIVGSYLVGSVPVGVIVGRLRGFDPRAIGSGNIGMTNVARAAGTGAAAITFAGDVLKGLIPVVAVRMLGLDVWMLALAGLAAFVGSICSVFLGFRGGRGVSASLGVWIGLAPLPIAISLGVFAAAFALTRIVSFASISASIALPPAAAALSCPRPYVLLAIVMAALVLLRHRENIARLIRGEEPTFGPVRRGQAGRPDA